VATRFTDVKKYFVSEASVYRLLKAHDLITSPAYIVVKAADQFKDKTTAPNELWQNGHTERLIGSIRRECLDHVLILGEAHLCQILRAYGDYYNRIRTHLARGCAYHLSHPDIFVMESAEEWDCSGQSFIADC
jgi:Integrase core domain